MASSPIHLDTPVFVERVFGRAEMRRLADALVKQPGATSSSYVRQQFKATFLSAAVLAHNKLKETGDIPDALEALDTYPVQEKQGQKARKVMIALMRRNEPVNAMIATLARWIEVEILKKFDRGLLLTDATKCCWASATPQRDSNGFYRFRAKCTLEERQPCAIDEFWTDRKHHLQVIATTAGKGVPKHVNAASKAAKEVVSEDKPPRGKRCWYALSDAVIVCESAVGSQLATTNVKDFVPLAAAANEDRTVVHPFKVGGGKAPAAPAPAQSTS